MKNKDKKVKIMLLITILTEFTLIGSLLITLIKNTSPQNLLFSTSRNGPEPFTLNKALDTLVILDYL